jgi:negative regulator of sigma E activity
VLAQLARGINDHLSDEGRDQLIHRAPDLAGLGRRTPGVTAAVTDAVLDTCTALDPQHRDRWHHRARRLRSPATTPRPWLSRQYTNLTATALVCCGVLSVVEVVADQPTARRDQALLGMLDRALNTLGPAADTSPATSVRKLADPRGRGQRSRDAAP